MSEPEFGHHASSGPNGFIDSWGSGPFVITVGTKQFRFEDSDRFGPSLVTASGDIAANPWPTEKSPFWRAHRIWVKQGRRIEDGGVCVWDEVKPTTIQMVNKRTGFLVDQGDEDGEVIRLPASDTATRALMGKMKSRSQDGKS